MSVPHPDRHTALAWAWLGFQGGVAGFSSRIPAAAGSARFAEDPGSLR